MKLTPYPERCLAGLVNLVCGAATGRRALRFAREIYPAGKPKASLHRCRFLLRTLWYRAASMAWFDFLDSDPARRSLLQAQPRIAEKLHRPYRRSDFGAGDRLAALTSHARAIENLGWSTLRVGLCRQPLTVARFVGKDDIERSLLLDAAPQFEKEGDLCLHLFCRGTRVYTLAFSFIVADPGVAGAVAVSMDIGCLQGPTGASAPELIRDTTKALHGLRPKDLMAVGLRALAQAVGSDALVGVCGARHIYRHWRKKKDISFDYDSYWLEQQGQRRANGDFALSALQEPGAIEDVPSKKRAQVLRKRALVADVQAQIVQALGRPGEGVTPVAASARPERVEPGPQAGTKHLRSCAEKA